MNSSSFLQNLEASEFTDVRPLFPPLMHTVCLVYSNSEYYSTAARIIVLMEVEFLFDILLEDQIDNSRKFVTS